MFLRTSEAQMKEDQRNENESYYQLKSFHKYFIESKLVDATFLTKNPATS